MSSIERDIIVNGTLKVVQPEFNKTVLTHNNWVIDSWREFTFLSDNERKILKQIKPSDVKLFLLKLMRDNYQGSRKQKSRKVICIETGELYASVKHCADALGLTEKVVYRALNCFKHGRNYKAGKKYNLIYA